MRKLILNLAAFLALFFMSSAAYAQADCELPDGIDEDERYWILMRGDTKARAFKILDVDGCWFLTYRTDENHRWHLIKNIVYIGSKEVEE